MSPSPGPSTTSTTTTAATGSPSPSFSPNNFDEVDLELLHHFTVSTSLSFAQDPVLRNLCRVNLPQVGFRYRYVLHALLSVAALHRTRFAGAWRDFNVTRAILHHSTASSIAHLLVPFINGDALCVLAYYSVLLSKHESIWCMEGWAFELMERVYTNLSPVHRPWVRWAVEEIGWVPTVSSARPHVGYAACVISSSSSRKVGGIQTRKAAQVRDSKLDMVQRVHGV